jgi:dihydroxyacetone kinase-like protein
MITTENLHAWIDALQQVYRQNKVWLTELDAAIGDADHGINMDRGFNAARAALADETCPADMGDLLKAVAMMLIKTVGGAAGPLYGTFFLRAAAVCGGKTALAPADVAALFEAGLAGVVQRGKAQLADKTMVDALTPAVEAMQQAAAGGADMAAMLSAGVTAARQGMAATTAMQARKGRASYLGERSIGHQDPGASSAWLLVKTAAQVWG